MKTIFVDFNTMQADPQERVTLGQMGTPLGDRLPPLAIGEQVMLTDEAMDVEATVEYDPAFHTWLAQPNWKTMHDR